MTAEETGSIDLDAFWKELHISKKVRLYEDAQELVGSFEVIPPRPVVEETGSSWQYIGPPQFALVSPDGTYTYASEGLRDYLNQQERTIAELRAVNKQIMDAMDEGTRNAWAYKGRAEQVEQALIKFEKDALKTHISWFGEAKKLAAEVERLKAELKQTIPIK